MLNHTDPFIRMAVHAILGALLGLLAGLVVGLFIRFVGSMIPPFVGEQGPQDMAPFLGMGFGTLVGAIFGGVVGLKK